MGQGVSPCAGRAQTVFETSFGLRKRGSVSRFLFRREKMDRRISAGPPEPVTPSIGVLSRLPIHTPTT